MKTKTKNKNKNVLNKDPLPSNTNRVRVGRQELVQMHKEEELHRRGKKKGI